LYSGAPATLFSAGVEPERRLEVLGGFMLDFFGF